MEITFATVGVIVVCLAIFAAVCYVFNAWTEWRIARVERKLREKEQAKWRSNVPPVRIARPRRAEPRIGYMSESHPGFSQENPTTEWWNSLGSVIDPVTVDSPVQNVDPSPDPSPSPDFTAGGDSGGAGASGTW